MKGDPPLPKSDRQSKCVLGFQLFYEMVERVVCKCDALTKCTRSF